MRFKRFHAQWTKRNGMMMTSRMFRPSGRQPGSFLALGLVLTLLIWAMGAGFAWHSYVTEENRARTMARGVSKTLAFNAATTLNNIDAALKELTQEFGNNWNRYRFERFRATALLRSTLTGISALNDATVLDAQGRVVHRHDRPQPLELSETDWGAFKPHGVEADDSMHLSLFPDGALTASRPYYRTRRQISWRGAADA